MEKGMSGSCGLSLSWSLCSLFCSSLPSFLSPCFPSSSSFSSHPLCRLSERVSCATVGKPVLVLNEKPLPVNIPHHELLESWRFRLYLLRCLWPFVVSNYEGLTMKISRHEALGLLVLPGLSIAKNITLLLQKENSWEESCCGVLGVH